jgi:hypothetical protein
MTTLRRIPPRKADIDRVIKCAQAAGLAVVEIQVQPDGSFRVLTGTAAASEVSDLDAWRAKRAARKAQGA